MLAKYHLSEILLNHGPLPIRHLMGYLTTSVPGFASIPPAKARRLVVAALEGKGSNGEGGGVDGDVEFIKVGWGRWDAKRRGQPARGDSPSASRTSPGVGHPASIPIIRASGSNLNDYRSRLGATLGSSVGGRSSVAFSHDERDRFMDPMDYEADKMSLDDDDESGSASCSEAPDDCDDPRCRRNDDPEDATDEEDWAAIGAAALRAESYNARSMGQSPFSTLYSDGLHPSGIRSFSTGMARPPELPSGVNLAAFNNTTMRNNSPLSAMTASEAQEREAVDALLRLRSM